eukprot:scaffold38769_cov35-Tisochrysis_lutea.AAC.2
MTNSPPGVTIRPEAVMLRGVSMLSPGGLAPEMTASYMARQKGLYLQHSDEVMKGVRVIFCCDSSQASGLSVRSGTNLLPTTLKMEGAPCEGASQGFPAITLRCAACTMRVKRSCLSGPRGPVPEGRASGIFVMRGLSLPWSSSL